jgi:hypothetical protein
MSTHQTSSPRRSRTSSAAAARRLRDTLTTSPQPVAELPAELAGVIEQFVPKPPLAYDWSRLRPVVGEVMALSTIRGAESVRKHLTHLGYFFVWADQQSIPVAVTSLVRAHVDEYTRVGMPQSTEKSRADRRARLRSVADQVNPGQAPDRGVPIPRPVIRPPYTGVELEQIMRVVGTQPTRERTRKAALCVGLGAGAGLDSRDFRGLRRGHVADHGPGGITVQVPADIPRTVHVRSELEDLVRLGIAGVDSGQLLLGRVQDRRNLAAQAVADVIVLGTCPRIEQARLRATWLAALLRQPVPLDVILQAAGLRSARTVVDLIPHLEPVDPDRVARFLRGTEVSA